MGQARIHNDLESAAKAAGGSCRFRDSGRTVKKTLEAGDPSDLTHVAIFFASLAVILKTALPALKDAMIAWLRSRSDREIELTVGKHTVRIKGTNDVERALKTLETMIDIGAGTIDSGDQD